MTAFEMWPKPNPEPSRKLKHRWLAKLWARLGGYFWLPCPLCDQMFGGHEASNMAIYDNPEHPTTGKVVCAAHDPIWPGWMEIATYDGLGREIDPTTGQPTGRRL